MRNGRFEFGLSCDGTDLVTQSETPTLSGRLLPAFGAWLLVARARFELTTFGL
jgi:hypothetical protein